MTKAIWAVFGAMLLIATLQYAQWELQYDYLYDSIPMCEPEKEEGIEV